MDFNLVEFACDKDDEIKFYFLDEAKYDDWCNAEPQQGYKHFKLIWSGDIQQILARSDLKDIFVDCKTRL